MRVRSCIDLLCSSLSAPLEPSIGEFHGSRLTRVSVGEGRRRKAREANPPSLECGTPRLSIDREDQFGRVIWATHHVHRQEWQFCYYPLHACVCNFKVRTIS